MLAFVELFSMFLAAFLPGLLLVHVLKPRVEIVGAFALSIGLSLLINHFVVLGLTAIGLYNTVEHVVVCGGVRPGDGGNGRYRSVAATSHARPDGSGVVR